jgi:hypothetical protein
MFGPGLELFGRAFLSIGPHRGRFHRQVPRRGERRAAGACLARKTQAHLEQHRANQLVDRDTADDQCFYRSPELSKRVSNDRSEQDRNAGLRNETHPSKGIRRFVGLSEPGA